MHGAGRPPVGAGAPRALGHDPGTRPGKRPRPTWKVGKLAAMETSSHPVCARCPRVLGTSCCEVREDEKLATLTLADVERIARHAARSAEIFCEDEWLSELEAQRYEARRPLYEGYFRHQPRRLTLRRKDGACVFLDRARGCTLGPEVRPTACRLYPLELWPDGVWSLQVERHGSVEAARTAPGSCLAVEEASELEPLANALGMTRAQVEALGEQLREEVKRHARDTAPGAGRTDGRRGGGRRSGTSY